MIRDQRNKYYVLAIKDIVQNKQCTNYMLIFYVKWELIKHIFTIKIQEVLKL